MATKSFKARHGIAVGSETSSFEVIDASGNITANSISLTSPLAIPNGGTGAVTAGEAITALAPGASTLGQVLTYGGASNSYSWAAPGALQSVAGTTITTGRQTYTATSNQTLFSGCPTYTLGSGQLRVYINGVRQIITVDYTETSTTSFTLTTGANTNDLILAEVDGYTNWGLTASTVTNVASGTISSTDVQSAINELDSEKAAKTDSIYIGTTAVQINRSSGALSLAGISGISGLSTINNGDTSTTVTFGGPVAITGNLTVNGTTTVVNSTTISVDDPIITLGGDTAPTSDDNKDRGVEFRWHNGASAKVGFFGFDDSTGKLTFIPDATNTSEVFSGAVGTIDVGAVHINGSQIAASNLSNGTTGSGSVVLATTPTFGTSLISPIVYGSASSGGNLTVSSTSHATKGTLTIGETGNALKLIPNSLPGSTAFVKMATDGTISTDTTTYLTGTYYAGSVAISGSSSNVTTPTFATIAFDSSANRTITVNSATTERDLSIIGSQNTNTAASTAGYVNITGGAYTGANTTGTSYGGNVVIAAGAATGGVGGTATGGTTYVRGGTATGGTTNTIGSVIIGDSNTSTVTIGTSGVTTTVNGTFKVSTATISTGGAFTHTLPAATTTLLGHVGASTTAGYFNTSATTPTAINNRLNYEGYIYATKFYGDGTTLTGVGTIGDTMAMAIALG